MLDILKQIDHWASSRPDRLAFTGTQGEIVYRKLVEDSNRLAAYLLKTIPGDRSPIAVIGHKQPEMLVAFLGAVKSGHAYIPIDDSYPPSRVERIAEIAQPALRLDPQRVQSILAETPQRPGFTYASPAPGDPWYILFTSGSTGEPKGVVITAECLSSFVEWMLAEQRFGEDEVFLNQAPFSFDLSVMDLYPCLVMGGTEVAVTRDEIANLKHLYTGLSRHPVTTWVSTPSFADMCLAERSFDQSMLPEVRRFLFCGETLSPDLARELLRRFPQAQVWNTYGPTETTVATTSILITPEILENYAPLPVGYSKPDATIQIFKPGTTQPAAENERGEIIIAGTNVSPGYLAREDLNQKSFITYQNWRAYRTGDWGRLQNSLLFFEGRMDNQIKLHGYRIELGDIESNLCQLEEVQDAIVLPVNKNGKVDSLTAFIILSQQASRISGTPFETTQALKRKLGQKLPAYMVPRRFIYLNEYPLTTNGKADRRKLAERIG